MYVEVQRGIKQDPEFGQAKFLIWIFISSSSGMFFSKNISQLYISIKESAHLSLASYKRDTDKQWRPWSDAAERGVWSGSILFALSSEIPTKPGNNKN